LLFRVALLSYILSTERTPALPAPQITASRSEADTVVTKAVLRAADRLGLTARVLAGVTGLSETTISRMKRDEFRLEPGSKPFELAVLFIRMFRSLDAITGGDEKVAASWLGNPNIALGARPIEKLQTVSGLVDVIAYLDARRALV
jgi:hypothetical protein